MSDMILKAKGNDKAIVLVVDRHTSRILSSCLRMYDIMEAGVIVLQNIELGREKLDLPAIYFIDPTQKVIDSLIKDFSNVKRPQYESIHLFFTARVKPDQMKRISENKILVKRIKTFVELNVDFIALESRVFTFDRPHSIPRLYLANDTTDISAELSIISRHLVSLCLTLGEDPIVRYSNKLGKASLNKALATFFEEDWFVQPELSFNFPSPASIGR
jgi:syntaxin-binding protein 1